MDKAYSIVRRDDAGEWAKLLAEIGQALLPIVELIEGWRRSAFDAVFDGENPELRWATAVWLMTEKNFRKIMECRDLGMLKAALACRPAYLFTMRRHSEGRCP